MSTDIHRKVRAEHLQRDAFLYVRHNADPLLSKLAA
jgi:hypothetical protein